MSEIAVWSLSVEVNTELGKTNYFTSFDPHHEFIDFLTGKSSGILSGILSGISSGILSGKSSWAFYLAYLLAYVLAYLLA